MAVITFAEDFTTIDDAEDVATWDGWGNNQGKWDDDIDIFVEGTQSVGCQPNQLGDSGWGVDIDPSNFNATTNYITIWVYITPGFVDTSANKGVYVRVGSGANWADYVYDYLVGGSEVAWVGRGWHVIVLDANRTTGRTQPGANAPNLASVRRVGLGFDVHKTASKSTVLAIDIMQYGTYLEVTGPYSNDSGVDGLDFNDNGVAADTITRSDGGDFTADGIETGDQIIVTGTTNNNGEYAVTNVVAATITLASGDLAQTELNVTTAYVDSVVGFQDILDKDVADDSWFGIVTKSPNGIFEINGPLILGDQSGTGRIYFRSRGEKIVFTDQPAYDANMLSIVADEDTGKTVIEFGDSTGTGDDRVGFSGSIFTENDEFTGCDSTIDLSGTVDTIWCFGSSFLGIGGGVSFAADTDHLVTNCAFDNCGQVDLGSAESRNLTFSGYDSASDAALLWNANIDIENSRFLANANATSDASAIEHPAAGEFDYTNLTFAGNDYDVHNSSAGLVEINNLGTSNANTHKETGGGSTTIVTAVFLRLTELIANSEVRIYRTSDGAALAGIENSGVTFQYNYVFPGADFAVYAHILHMDYLFNRLDITLTNDDQIIPVQYSTDRVYSNP
jgi:hypothetical protein